MAQLGQFNDAWFAEFRSKSRVTDEEALRALRDDLVTIGRRYRRIIETTPCGFVGAPFNKTLTQRAAWLQANVLTPAEKLMDALSDDQRAWFATWPYEEHFEGLSNTSELTDALKVLHEYTARVKGMLHGEQKGDAATHHELQFYIFTDIIRAVRRHLPDLTPKLGVYEEWEENGKKKKQFVGAFPDAIRHIYAEITGKDEQLVRLIRQAVKDPDWDW